MDTFERERSIPLARIEARSIADMAYLSIRESIVTGRLDAGTRLVEARLAHELGVSKAPIREALKKLRDERLVVEQPRYGTFVRTLTDKDFIDVYNMRLLVEGLAAALIVRAQAPLDVLEQLVGAMRRDAEAGDVSSLADTDVRFHNELCAAADNEYLQATFHTLSGPIRMVLTRDNDAYGRLGDIVEEHSRLVDALRSGSEDDAVSMVRSHILSAAAKRGFGADDLPGHHVTALSTATSTNRPPA